MSRTSVTANDLAYTFSPGDRALLGERIWAIVTGRLIDELTGEPPAAPQRVTPVQPGIGVKTGGDGTFALVARPFVRFAALGASAYPLDFSVAVPGFLPLSLHANVPLKHRLVAAPAPAPGATLMTLNNAAGMHAGQALLIGPMGPTQERAMLAHTGPAANQVTLVAGIQHSRAVGDPVVADEFEPVALGNIPLHRAPVTLSGRAVRRDAASITTVPVPNAKVVVTGVWRTAEEVRRHLPAQPASMVALAPGLYARRASLATTLEAVALPPVAGENKLLLAHADAGVATIRLSDSTNVVVNTVLLLDADQPGAAEYIPVTTVQPGLTASEPATIGLAFPLRRAHRAGALVKRVTPQPPVTTKKFAQDAAIGDQVAFLNNIAALDVASTVRVADGVQPDEYQRVSVYQAAADVEGYFRLPGIARVAQLQLQASAAALTTVTIDVQPNYTERGNWLGVVFP